MNSLVEWISQPWPWYVAGPIIGLMVPLHLILLNRTFGISSSFRHMCAACVPNNLDFLKYDWKAESWNLVFVVGVLLGSFLAAQYFASDAPIALSEAAVSRMHDLGIQDLSGQHPAELFAWNRLGDFQTLVMIVLGGFLVGFGTRYAGGCTSGHAIMGLSHFQLPSLVAVLGFFTGGLLMSWILLPLILQ
ncbi:MAG: YeeE/YedE thiosulfate transporter family protein [Bacteroidetes bacterium]|nr:YeeE/YedE thiosulfate transporter family protein [Bacteroidota bacterium]MDA0903711.1 YeeE/YedE thiosulfate transporter family protein [Bacteroidota bacterium]MDA1242469.1 YeeE/YedE thiosulfate transporter family protein [Bacteroidota bacterium]